MSSSIVCPCCGAHRLTPKMLSIHEVRWGECACSDQQTCLAHQVDPYSDDRPSRPTDAALAEKAERMYVERLKAHMERMSRFSWVEKKLKEVQ